MTEENEVLEETTLDVKEEPAVAGTSSVSPLAGDRDEPPSPKGKALAPADEKGASEVEHLRAELESVRGQVTRLEHERYLLSRGVPEEDLDYYAFKIEHMEGAKSDFQKSAKEYLKAHPVRRTAVSSGADLTAGSTRRPATSSELMNQLLRNR